MTGGADTLFNDIKSGLQDTANAEVVESSGFVRHGAGEG
jgi:hypothetical protein